MVEKKDNPMFMAFVCKDECDFRYKDTVSVGSFDKCITNFNRHVCTECGALKFEIDVKDGMTKGIKHKGEVVLKRYMREENGYVWEVKPEIEKVEHIRKTLECDFP